MTAPTRICPNERLARAARELQAALNGRPDVGEAMIEHFDVCRAGEPMRRRFVVIVGMRKPAPQASVLEAEP